MSNNRKPDQNNFLLNGIPVHDRHPAVNVQGKSTNKGEDL
jgi:hypothetical protein